MQSSSWSIRHLAGSVRNEAEAAGEAVRARLAPLSRRSRFAVREGAMVPSPARGLVPAPRIVLDGVFFQLHRTGIARMWESVMAEWSASGFAEHVVVLDRCDSAPKFAGFMYRPFTPLRRFDTQAQQRALEAVCKAEQADVFISTYYTLPTETPSVMCVHDMIPETIGFDLGLPEWRAKAASIAHAESFVCVSENTSHDLDGFYPQAASKPRVIAHNAAASFFHPATRAGVEALCSALGLPRDYVMFMGARDVRYKNAALVANAICRLAPGERPAILFVGGAPELEQSLQQLRELGTVVVSRLSDAELVAAYSGARALLYPSKYEGFGIPILEAMACGCPVITCRNSALPEVAGNAALYVSEDDAEALASAIMMLAEPAVADGLRVRGIERAAQFTWRRSADAIADTLRRAAVRRE